MTNTSFESEFSHSCSEALPTIVIRHKTTGTKYTFKGSIVSYYKSVENYLNGEVDCFSIRIENFYEIANYFDHIALHEDEALFTFEASVKVHHIRKDFAKKILPEKENDFFQDKEKSKKLFMLWSDWTLSHLDIN